MTNTELRKLREQIGYTQTRMAEALGVSHRTYCYMESGERAIRAGFALAVQSLARQSATPDNPTRSRTTKKIQISS